MIKTNNKIQRRITSKIQDTFPFKHAQITFAINAHKMINYTKDQSSSRTVYKDVHFSQQTYSQSCAGHVIL